jgi:hypothetical protein
MDRLEIPGITSPDDVAAGLDAVGYLADDGLATAVFLCLRMARPLFLEGEAGVGKTSLAHALARIAHADLLRLQCYEGLDAAQALYDWDFPRQLLRLRVAEAAGASTLTRLSGISTAGASLSPGRCCGRSRPARAYCSSMRSTAPTTNSRRSCSRCSAISP